MGTCSDTVDRYACDCRPGWGGENCEVNLDYCSSWPCRNGAACVDAGGEYSCLCPDGFLGDNCAEDINECDAEPCDNGGICLDQPGGFLCACLPDSPWTGPTCGEHFTYC